MRKLFAILTFMLALSVQPDKTESYVMSVLSSGAQIRWELGGSSSPIVRNGRVVYNLNPSGSDNVSFSQVEAAIAASFQAWEDIPTSAIAFTRGENRTETGARNDGIFQIYWRENTLMDDGLDLTGTLAVTRISSFSSGEIADASMVFNGVENTWATNGAAQSADIAEVATHEIGHAFGLSHSPVGAATMFPRTGYGFTRGRTPATDDQIATSLLYPANGFLSQTGALRGFVRDGGGGIFGANVVVSDANGNVLATALSQRDGSYSVRGLPPGNHTAFVEALDGPGGLYFGAADLTGFYSTLSTNFLTTNDVGVSIQAAGETARDFTVTRNTPAFNAHLVYNPATGGFSNLGATARAGAAVTLGVGGPNLPTSGAPLSVSGAGVNITRTRFGTLSGNGGNAILIDVVISGDAAPGARSLIVSGGGQRSILPGALEIVGTGAQTLSVVSAANFASRVAAESIVSAFGRNLATVTLTANSTPLPTALGGTSVRLRDSAGVERLAPLFFVSPTQVNYQMTPGLALGTTSVSVTSGGGQTSTGTLQLEALAPGLFAAAGNGQGPAAALALRIRQNGSQSFEPAVRFDAALNRFVTVPIDLGLTTDQVFLVLFGTGFRNRSSLNNVLVNVGGRAQQVTFAGAQGSLVGLDQLNARLERGLIGRGEVDVTLSVDGRAANTLRVNIK
jgi:uncharacterized protein (TIGR03437 family)